MIIKRRIKETDINNPEVVSQVFHAILQAEHITDREKEHFWVMGLDGRHHVKYIELVSLGILTNALVHPREVFRLAIMEAIEAIIVCHNHPSDSIEPSESDIMTTKRLTEAGKIIGIKLLDHIIIANESTENYSFQWHNIL